MVNLAKFIKEHKILAVLNFIAIMLLLWFVISWFDVITSNGIDSVGCHSWNLFKILFD